MNLYLARDQNNVPVWLYDEERDTAIALTPVSNRAEILSAPQPPPRVDEKPRKKIATKKQITKTVKPKGYQKGVCGGCGKPGHSKWHCPDRNDKPSKKHTPPSSAGKRKTCSNCGKPGHFAKTCPEFKPPSGFEEAPKEEVTKYCQACYSNDHNTRECPELGSTIARLKEQGMNSIHIAQKLKLPIKAVNEHWTGEEKLKETDDE